MLLFVGLLFCFFPQNSSLSRFIVTIILKIFMRGYCSCKLIWWNDTLNAIIPDNNDQRNEENTCWKKCTGKLVRGGLLLALLLSSIQLLCLMCSREISGPVHYHLFPPPPICVNTISVNEYGIWAHPNWLVLETMSNSLFITSSGADQHQPELMVWFLGFCCLCWVFFSLSLY